MSTFGPFKRFYNRTCDAWLTSFPGQPLTIYYIAELAGKAFSKAFFQENNVLIQKDWNLSIKPEYFHRGYVFACCCDKQ